MGGGDSGGSIVCGSTSQCSALAKGCLGMVSQSHQGEGRGQRL